jgi:hypothetical protein
MGIQKTFNNFQNTGYSVSYFILTNVIHDCINDITSFQALVYTSKADRDNGCSPVCSIYSNNTMIGNDNPMKVSNISQLNMDERKAVYQKIFSDPIFGTLKALGVEYDLSDGIEI